jgi:hypothetical protein
METLLKDFRPHEIMFMVMSVCVSFMLKIIITVAMVTLLRDSLPYSLPY